MSVKIVFLDSQTIGPQVHITKPQNKHQWIDYKVSYENEVIEKAQNADIIVTNKVPVRAHHIKNLPRLKMIAIAATGYDVIDIHACHKITVSNVHNYAKNTASEHTFALILALMRNIHHYRSDVINGVWQQSPQFCFFNHPIRDLHRLQLGILGSGSIGKSVAKIARSFGMKVVFSERKGMRATQNRKEFTEVLSTSDILTLHLPLLDSTYHLIADDEFSLMQKKPLIINTARGSLVDEYALVRALDKGLVSGIGFDVLSQEPAQSDNPLISIAHRPNVIITPHVAWASNQAMQTLWNQVINNIDNFINGKPSNVICH